MARVGRTLRPRRPYLSAFGQYPLTSTLATDFNQGVPAFFDANFGTASIINGQLNCPTISSYSGFQTNEDYCLAGSAVYVQVVQASGIATTGNSCQNSIKIVSDGTNSIEMIMNHGSFRGRVTKNNVVTDVLLNGGTYNSVTHQWWRVRESGGTVFFDTAPDGLTWTNLNSQTHGLAVQQIKVALQAGFFGTETAPIPSIYDNLNWQIVADPTQGPLARSLDTLDTFVIQAGLDFPGTARALDTADVLGLGAADTVGAPARASTPAADILRVDVPKADTAGPPVRALNSLDALNSVLADLSQLSDARAVGGTDTLAIDVPELEAPPSSQALALGAGDLLGIGVPDAGNPTARAVNGLPDFLTGAATPDPPFQPARAVWSPDTAAIQTAHLDSVGPPARALDTADHLAGDTVLSDPAGGTARAASIRDVLPVADVQILDTPAFARSIQQLDAWTAWHPTTPSWAVPGSQTFPTESPDTAGISRFDTFQVDVDTAGNVARAFGQFDTTVGATQGRLSNLPIMRVLADFTQGPPGQPASTAGGTTVELTQAMAVTAMSIRRGRQYELGKPQAGTATITVSDPNELLNPTNPSSPYNSGGATLVSYRPMRVTAVWNSVLYTIYTGYIERYPQTWVDAGFRGVKPLECVDGIAMLSNTEVRQSYFDLIVKDGATIYIPYDEKAAPCRAYVASSKALLAGGTSLPGNPRQGSSAYYQTQLLVGGTALRCVSSVQDTGTVSYGGDAMPDGTPALQLASTNAATSDAGPRWIARMDTQGGSFNLNTGGSTVEMWFRWTEGVANIGVCESVTDGEFDFIDVPTESNPFVGLVTEAGRLFFVVSMGETVSQWGAEASSTFAPFSGYPDGLWHYAAMTFSVNSGNVNMTCTFDNAEILVTTPYTPAYIGINSVHTHATSNYNDPASSCSIAQFAYYATPLTQAQRLAHYARGAGNVNELAPDRFTRLMATYWGGTANVSTPTDHHNEFLDNDFIYGVYPSPGVDTSTAVQPYTVLQAQQLVDSADRGMTYFDRNGYATFEPRNGRLAATTSLGTFGDRPGELPYTVLEYDYDPTQVYTRTQITKVDGGQQITNDATTAQANFGVRNYTESVQLYNEYDLFQFGMFILAKYSTQRVRIRQVELEPSAVGSDALWQVVLGLELSQRFTVNRRTANGTLYSHDFYVEQIEHQIDPATSTWKVRLQMSPVLYSQAVGHVDVAGQSILGTQTVVSY